MEAWLNSILYKLFRSLRVKRQAPMSWMWMDPQAGTDPPLDEIFYSPPAPTRSPSNSSPCTSHYSSPVWFTCLFKTFVSLLSSPLTRHQAAHTKFKTKRNLRYDLQRRRQQPPLSNHQKHIGKAIFTEPPSEIRVRIRVGFPPISVKSVPQHGNSHQESTSPSGSSSHWPEWRNYH